MELRKDGSNMKFNFTYPLGLAKAINYTAQSALLPLVDQIATGRKKDSFKDFTNQVRTAMPKLTELLKKESDNIENGLYPAEVIFEEMPWTHYSRIPFLLADAFRAARQREQKKADVFETQDLDYVNESPEYFRRNFHFQNGGYLNDKSAELYNHQVEVLFAGTANVMRRQIIPSLKNHFNMSDGEGLRFLEIGSGVGTLTRSIALAFPKAQITCVDASPHYLKLAQRKLARFKRINYVQAFGEELPFKDESFDAIFSCYLYHELPEKIRHEVTQEKMRVLKKNGFIAIADSIQKDDDETLNWALQQFPINFHEPFYKNYTERSLEELLQSYEVTGTTTEINFLTKIVSATKK